jgi:hypothetical protein
MVSKTAAEFCMIRVTFSAGDSRMEQRYCQNCGFRGVPKKYLPSSGWAEGCLWIVSIFALFIPILIYKLARSGRAYNGCPICGARNMIPLSSPLVPRTQASLPSVAVPGIMPAPGAQSQMSNTRATGFSRFSRTDLCMMAMLGLGILIAVVGPLVEPRDSSHPSNDAMPPLGRVAVIRPSIDPPKFRVFRAEINQSMAVIVPSNTTDEQLHKAMIAQGDWTCTIAEFTGTMMGPMTMADGTVIAPTNKGFTVDFCTVAHWNEKGEIVEENLFYDLMGMLKQIGVM